MRKGFAALAWLLQVTRADQRTAIIGQHVRSQMDEMLCPGWARSPDIVAAAEMRVREEWDFFAKELMAFERAARREA